MFLTKREVPKEGATTPTFGVATGVIDVDVWEGREIVEAGDEDCVTTVLAAGLSECVYCLRQALNKPNTVSAAPYGNDILYEERSHRVSNGLEDSTGESFNRVMISVVIALETASTRSSNGRDNEW